MQRLKRAISWPAAGAKISWKTPVICRLPIGGSFLPTPFPG
ncbi:MAG: hypothetical protein ACLVJY_10775 [Frisingicoccus sp.]